MGAISAPVGRGENMAEHINRRTALIMLGTGGLLLAAPGLFADNRRTRPVIEKISKSEAQWRRILTPEQYRILREEGTERPYSSPLNGEHRKGVYLCAGCDLELFSSEMKFDSGTGWPSFSAAIEGHVETKRDHRLLYPRTEYHCARCSGHQGHVFDDGPEPTGKRWCNNGLALKFMPE